MQTIAQLFDDWNASLQTGDPDAVTAHYAPDAILLPTVSNQVRHNHAEIRDYFVRFLTYRPVGRIIEQNIRDFGDLAINSGTYRFELTEGSAKREVDARYTFVYRKIADRWSIIEHHSSLMPE